MGKLNLPGKLGSTFKRSLGIRGSQTSKNKKLAIELVSPDDFLNEISEIPINAKFDIKKQKMPVDDDSDKVSFFGKNSHGS